MKKIILIVVISILCINKVDATYKTNKNTNDYFKSYEVGKIIQAEEKLLDNGKIYTLYRLDKTLYCPLQAVIEIGGEMEEENGIIYIKLTDYKGEEIKIQKQLQGTAYINTKCIYIGNLRTYSIIVEDQILIPLEALEIIGKITREGEKYQLIQRYYDLNKYIQIKENKIVNRSPYFLKLTYKDIGWDGGEYIEKIYKDISLEAGEEIDRVVELKSDKKKVVYLTTLLVNIYDIENEQNEENSYGQKNTTLFHIYQREVRLRELEQTFKPYIVTGVMKYPVGKFKEKEEVEIWRGEKRQYYMVNDKDEKKIMIPWGSVEVVNDLGIQWQQAKSEEIEEYANLKEIESETDHLIWTDLFRQRTYVLKGSKGNWKLERIMKCSSGKNTYLTPRGEFKLEYRMPYFGMGKGFMCKNAVVIFRDYMYHSILFDKTGNYVKEGKYQLGQRVSHGCVRLSEEDSKWFYDNVPLSSKVWIN